MTNNRLLLTVVCVCATTALLASDAAAQAASGTAASRAPNQNGRIPILEYHLIGDKDGTYSREVEHFKRDLQLLYDRGYRPITVAQLMDKKFDIPEIGRAHV